MTLEQELTIVSRVLALRRAGRIPPIWALDGRYRIGWSYDNAVPYSVHALFLLAEAGEMLPVETKPWKREPLKRIAAPKFEATLVPHHDLTQRKPVGRSGVSEDEPHKIYRFGV